MNIFKQYKETILYLFFGVLSTVVNIGTYVFFTRIINTEFMVANIAAWIVAVLFAYLTNKFFVFESKVTKLKFLIKEFISFVSCRILSLMMEMILMYIMIDMLLVNDLVVKILTNIVVIILNYIFSKLIIFKNKKA